MKKVLLVAFGLFLGLLLLEIGLNLAGFLVFRFHNRSPITPDAQHKVILCVGDSFVFGLGASAGEDFPSQLEKVLYDQSPAAGIKVVNAGVPGWNSSLVAHRFKENLRKYRPAWAVILAGSNDHKNYQGVDPRLFALTRQNGFSLPRERLQSFKSWRLLVALAQGLSARLENYYISLLAEDFPAHKSSPIQKSRRTFPCYDYLFKREYGRAKDCFLEMLKSNPRSVPALLGLSKTYTDGRSQNFSAAIGFLEQARAIEPRNLSVLAEMSWVYKNLGRYEDALDACLRALSLEKDNLNFYKEVIEILQLKPGLKEKKSTAIISVGIDRLEADLLRASAQEEVYRKLFLKNIKDMQQLARIAGVKVLLCTYPGDPRVNDYIRQAGALYDLEVVDLGVLFSGLIASGAEEELFAPDRHCNGRGYQIIARALAEKISSSPR